MLVRNGEDVSWSRIHPDFERFETRRGCDPTPHVRYDMCSCDEIERNPSRMADPLFLDATHPFEEMDPSTMDQHVERRTHVRIARPSTGSDSQVTRGCNSCDSIRKGVQTIPSYDTKRRIFNAQDVQDDGHRSLRAERNRRCTAKSRLFHVRTSEDPLLSFEIVSRERFESIFAKLSKLASTDITRMFASILGQKNRYPTFHPFPSRRK